MFEDLTQKLEIVFKKLRGEGKISETNIGESLREALDTAERANVEIYISHLYPPANEPDAAADELLEENRILAIARAGRCSNSSDWRF